MLYQDYCTIYVFHCFGFFTIMLTGCLMSLIYRGVLSTSQMIGASVNACKCCSLKVWVSSFCCTSAENLIFMWFSFVIKSDYVTGSYYHVPVYTCVTYSSHCCYNKFVLVLGLVMLFGSDFNKGSKNQYNFRISSGLSYLC